MIIAVDFDGTIVEHKYPEIGKEIPFAFETLKKLQGDGHFLILWTVREGETLDDAVTYCSRHGLEFSAINQNLREITGDEVVSSRKLQADVFIDDRNVGGLPDWGLIYQMIREDKSYHDVVFDSTYEPRKGIGGFFHRLYYRR